MVAQPGRGERNELAQGEERDEGKQGEGRVRPDDEGCGEDGHHYPPCAYPRIEVVDHGVGLRTAGAAPQDAADDRYSRQHAGDAADQPVEFMLGAHCAAPMTASRARLRKDCLSSLAMRCNGAPKRTVQMIGTGRKVPLGMLRCRFSRYTGMSS